MTGCTTTGGGGNWALKGEAVVAYCLEPKNNVGKCHLDQARNPHLPVMGHAGCGTIAVRKKYQSMESRIDVAAETPSPSHAKKADVGSAGAACLQKQKRGRTLLS